MISKINIVMDKSVFKLSILMLVIQCMFISSMIAVYSNSIYIEPIVILVIGTIGVYSIGIHVYERKGSISKSIAYPIFFALIVVITTPILYRDLKIISIVNVVMKANFWVSVLSISYIYGRKSRHSIESLKYYLLFTPIIAICFYQIYKIGYGEGIAAVSSIYYLILLLPFVLSLRNNKLKTTLSIIIMFCTLLSMKRTAFVCVTVTMFVWFLVNYNVKKKTTKKLLYTGVSVFIASMIILLFYKDLSRIFGIDIMSRFANMFEDGGSGRVDIWKDMFSMQKESNVLEWLFGHGFNAVYMQSTFKLSAHNDFLEILYDFGILGMILYANFYRILIKYCKQMYKAKSEWAGPCISSLALVFVMSLTSHLIIYPTYFIYFCVFWGVIVGSIEGNHLKI